MGSMFVIWRGDLYVFGRHVYRLDTGGFDTPEHWTWQELRPEVAEEVKRGIDSDSRRSD